MQCPERHILRLSPGSMRSSFVQQRAIAELILKVANVATPWIQRWNNGEGIQLISTGYSCVNGVNALLAAGKQRTWIIMSTICVCIYTYIYIDIIYIYKYIYILYMYIYTLTYMGTADSALQAFRIWTVALAISHGIKFPWLKCMYFFVWKYGIPSIWCHLEAPWRPLKSMKYWPCPGKNTKGLVSCAWFKCVTTCNQLNSMRV